MCPNYISEFQGIDIGRRPNHDGTLIGCVMLAFKCGGKLFSVEITRAAMERMVEDGEHVLNHSDYLNDSATVFESSCRVQISSLPMFDGFDIRASHNDHDDFDSAFSE